MSLLHAIALIRRRNLVALLAGILIIVPFPVGGQTAPAPPKSKPANSWSVRWQPIRLVNGSPVIFEVGPSPRLKTLSGTWAGHQVFFSFDQHSKTWYGIAGVSLETRPGRYSLELKGTNAGEKEVSFQREIMIGKAKYRSIAASVPKKFTEPDAEQLRKISEDKALKEQVFAQVDAEREWSGKFLAPVNAQISDVFGTARTFNGKVQSVHQGLDYAVPLGTPVAALNDGKVILARPLFFEGDCVVLDHGQGLLTLYMHFSKIEVKEGDTVKRGQRIGLSGGTGRATGPHLHVAVRWQGVYLNPATLLELKIP